MNRKAILIASHTNKHGFLPGAKTDLALYTSLLTAPLGGAWEDSEIVTLENPSKTTLVATLTVARQADFCFVTFSGHGEHHVGRQLSDTSLCLNDTEELYVGDLNPGCRRQVVVVDACRRLVMLETIKRAEHLMAANRAYSVDWMYRYRCRQLFDNETMQAEEGRVLMYSCGINQSAGETEDGGHFSKALVEAPAAWRDIHPALTQDVRAKTLEIPLAFELAKSKVPAPQEPVLYSGRRIKHFPFAVAP